MVLRDAAAKADLVVWGDPFTPTDAWCRSEAVAQTKHPITPAKSAILWFAQSSLSDLLGLIIPVFGSTGETVYNNLTNPACSK
jgi:hypothetical protein